jgi:hypothetical protein
MNPLSALRLLWRRRLAVAVGVPFALLAALSLCYHVSLGPPGLHSRAHTAGLASSQILLDSPQTQIAGLQQAQPEYGTALDLAGLITRAQLLASLMTTSPLADRIAAEARTDPQRLVIQAPTGFGPGVGSSSTISLDSSLSVIQLSVDQDLPIIRLSVSAPSRRAAVALSHAAFTAVRGYVAGEAGQAKLPGASRLVVSQMGAPTSSSVEFGTRRMYAVIAFLVLISLWAGALLAVPRFIQYWRELARAETAAAGEPG